MSNSLFDFIFRFCSGVVGKLLIVFNDFESIFSVLFGKDCLEMIGTAVISGYRQDALDLGYYFCM